MAADRKHGELGRVDPTDQLHVREDAGVAGEVDRATVFERDDEPGRLARIRPVVGPARVEGVDERELHAVDVDSSALVRPGEVVDLGPLVLEPAFQLDHGDDRLRLELLRQLDGLADVVGVSVRDRDHVDALGLLLRIRTLRIREPRVDVDTLSAGRVEPERSVPQPGYGRVSHRSPFCRACAAERKGTSARRANLMGWPADRSRPRSPSSRSSRTSRELTASPSRCFSARFRQRSS